LASAREAFYVSSCISRVSNCLRLHRGITVTATKVDGQGQLVCMFLSLYSYQWWWLTLLLLVGINLDCMWAIFVPVCYVYCWC